MTDAVLIDGHPTDRVPSDDRGLAYGDGVFRTIRIEAGKAQAWPFHYARLTHDCAALGFAAPPHGLLAADTDALCARVGQGVLKIVVTRGSGGRGYAPPRNAQPRRIITLHRGLPTTPGPLRLILCPLPLATPDVLAGVKHLNRLEQVLARQYCESRAMTDAAMCDGLGRIVCTTMRNLVLADEDGRLWTPDLSHAGVVGATLERLRAAISVTTDRDMQAAGLGRFQAAIACNSISGALAVSRIGDHVFTESSALAARANALLAESA